MTKDLKVNASKYFKYFGMVDRGRLNSAQDIKIYPGSIDVCMSSAC